MKDFPRFSILLGVLGVALLCGEVRQHATREGRVEPQTLERCNDAITSEGGTKPGNAGIRIQAKGCLCSNHMKVCDGSIQPVVELLVRSEELGLFGSCALKCIDRASGGLII